MLNVLVTGSNGQLGSEIKELVKEIPSQAEDDGVCKTEDDGVGKPEDDGVGKPEDDGVGKPEDDRVRKTEDDNPTSSSGLTRGSNNYFFTDRDSLDISNEEDVKRFIEVNNINIIINCAAYTAVDKAEEDEINADKINHLAVKYLAKISKEKNIRLIHVSTDYVFNGEAFKPYVESDVTNPNGIYGKTKLDGEKAMLGINPDNSMIIRTSWVYSSFGNNFVKTMLRLGKERDELGVIFDQVGTPTYARDLAKAILEIIPQLDSRVKPENDTDRHSQLDWEYNVQVYHYSNEGVLSWYDFSKEIMRMAKIDCQINPIETKEYPTPATRPHYSLLNKSKIKKEFNLTIPYWKDSLDECLRTMGERK